MLGKWFRDKKGWQWVEVTVDEAKQLQEELRKQNIEIMQECLGDAGNFMNSVEIAIALFDKRASAFFTIEKAYLDRKCKELREAEKDVGTKN